ncbi:MAG: hypothetical protein IT379_33480 [Deltaproteobacteria bacterium]|nr:hypothetical protein [Deltaproteobacteria bacterium]
MSTCVWTTACLNPEDSFGGGAPNTNVGSCIATFVNQHTQSGEPVEPWDDFCDCVAAGPSGCEELRACLLARNAICALPVVPSEMPDWIEGVLCPDGSRSCDGSCLETCSDPGTRVCAPDSSAILECTATPTGALVRRTIPCGRTNAPGSCTDLMGAAVCLAGEVGSCSGTSASCDGSVVTFCQRGTQVVFEYASVGQACDPMRGCVQGAECTFMDDVCMGNTLRTCVSGHRRDIDCTTLGGTCGTVRGARDACSAP